MAGMIVPVAYNRIKLLIKWLLVVGLVMVVISAGAFALLRFTATYAYHNTEITRSGDAPDFSLPDQDGNMFRLADQRGKIVYLFFGYTNCPDICPATLGDMRTAYRKLGEAASKVQVVFITVDPQRDTPAVLKQYLSSFDPHFIALRPSMAQLPSLLKSYGGFSDGQPDLRSASSYDVNHSTHSYVIDQTGHWRLLVHNGAPVADIVEDLQHLLQQ